MLQSNRIILTDVDGVLLEWEHHFTKWMLQRTLFDERGARYHPYRLLPDKQNTYEMAERIGLTKIEIRILKEAITIYTFHCDLFYGGSNKMSS